MMNIKRGFRFFHRRVIDTDNKPMEFQVTKISQGIIYYRAIEKDGKLSGFPQCCDIKEFTKYANIS